MAIKYTVYKITEADRTKKVFSVYADTYEIGFDSVDFYEDVVTPGAWLFSKDIHEQNMIASLNIETRNLLVIADDKLDDHKN